jgi:hypothetical protein
MLRERKSSANRAVSRILRLPAGPEAGMYSWRSVAANSSESGNRSFVMTLSTRTLIGFSALLLSIGCGGGQDPGTGGGTAGGASACSPSLPCFDLCLCGQGTVAQCASACSAANGGAPGTPGAGGAATVGAGGAPATGAGGVPTAGAGGVPATGTGGVPATGTGGVPATGTGGVPATGTGGAPATGTGGAPATGTGGAPGIVMQQINVSMDTFTVPIGGEIYTCQDFSNPFGKDVDILVSESQMTLGSHHMFAFRMPGLTNGPPVACPAGGAEFHEYIHTAQTPDQLTTYPAGVGRFMPAGQGLRLMTHYLNTTSAVITAHVNLSLKYVDPSQVQFQAAGIFLNNALALRVATGASTQTKTYSVGAAIKILGGASHMHSHGTHFHAATNDGRVLFDGVDWNEPAEKIFTPPMDIAAGSTITWSCDYQNNSGKVLTFGESAATNEMCIYSGSFYPAPGGNSISTL